MYRHRLRPVVACLIMWYRCISVMLLFSFEIWKKKVLTILDLLLFQETFYVYSVT